MKNRKLSSRVISARKISITKTKRAACVTKNKINYLAKFLNRTIFISADLQSWLLFSPLLHFYYTCKLCYLTHQAKRAVLAIMHVASPIIFAPQGAGPKKDTGNSVARKQAWGGFVFFFQNFPALRHNCQCILCFKSTMKSNEILNWSLIRW